MGKPRLAASHALRCCLLPHSTTPKAAGRQRHSRPGHCRPQNRHNLLHERSGLIWRLAPRLPRRSRGPSFGVTVKGADDSRSRSPPAMDSQCQGASQSLALEFATGSLSQGQAWGSLPDPLEARGHPYKRLCISCVAGDVSSQAWQCLAALHLTLRTASRFTSSLLVLEPASRGALSRRH